jgi:hypothetical protein
MAVYHATIMVSGRTGYIVSYSFHNKFTHYHVASESEAIADCELLNASL